jgi:hypothetical protein
MHIEIWLQLYNSKLYYAMLLIAKWENN